MGFENQASLDFTIPSLYLELMHLMESSRNVPDLSPPAKLQGKEKHPGKSNVMR
jgi:hypothetical protein